MGTLSVWHLALIALIVLLLFGNRLPSAMRSLGRGVTEFKKGLEGTPDEDEPRLKKESDEKKDKPAEKEKSTAEN